MDKKTWKNCWSSVQKIVAVGFEGALVLSLIIGLLFTSWWAVEKAREIDGKEVSKVSETKETPVTVEKEVIEQITQDPNYDEDGQPIISKEKEEEWEAKKLKRVGGAILAFGKYKGQTLSEVAETDRGLAYLDWLSGEDWVWKDMKRDLGTYLESPEIVKVVKGAVEREQKIYDEKQEAKEEKVDEENVKEEG